MNDEELREEDKAFTLGDNYPDCPVCGNKIFPTSITIDCISCGEQVHKRCSKLQDDYAYKCINCIEDDE
jgi:predicted RNA-binding Zn-ribbon protein involved in translation (DUF1610 family)